MLNVDLTISQRNEKMRETHRAEIKWNRKQLQTLLPLHFHENCFVISIDMYIPLPIERLNKTQQIEEHSAQFRSKLEELPRLRPLFVQCSFRIPPPSSVSHSWSLVIDSDNVMYVYDPSSEANHHSTSIFIRKCIPKGRSVYFCPYNFNDKIENSCGLYGACHWGSFAILYLSTICFDKHINQHTLCRKVGAFDAYFLTILLDFVNIHLQKRATSFETELFMNNIDRVL